MTQSFFCYIFLIETPGINMMNLHTLVVVVIPNQSLNNSNLKFMLLMGEKQLYHIYWKVF